MLFRLKNCLNAPYVYESVKQNGLKYILRMEYKMPAYDFKIILFWRKKAKKLLFEIFNEISLSSICSFFVAFLFIGVKILILGSKLWILSDSDRLMKLCSIKFWVEVGSSFFSACSISFFSLKFLFKSRLLIAV